MERTNISVVVSCHGQGNPWREDTENRSNPMVVVGAHSIAWHIMKAYAADGLRRFILCLGYTTWVIKGYFCNFNEMANAFTIKRALERVSAINAALAILITLSAGSSAANAAGSQDIRYWQTYCASDSGHVHSWTNGSGTVSVEQLTSARDGPRSAYLFLCDDQLRLRDLATRKQWTFDGGAWKEAKPVRCAALRHQGYTFQDGARWLSLDHYVGACTLWFWCKTINIHKGTFVYVYAEHAGNVIAITNYGDALLFRDGAWCRMTRHEGDRYECSDPQAPKLTAPRKVQFYSAIRYFGRTLIGEWPTGRIYEFDGSMLWPSDLSPPFVSEEPVGYEAQSMALYCGDLFVGYWPTGEVWRRSTAGEWSLAARLFSPSASKAFIPFTERSPDGLPWAFYGRRVTALVPWRDGLYASTSNLGGWKADTPTPGLTPAQQAEYGALFKLTATECRTSRQKHAGSN